VLVLLMEGFMKYAVEMGSGLHDIYTKFHKHRSRRSKVVRGDTHADTETQRGDLVSLLLLLSK
jgi:hypothetical protein